jgi:hypothetical protein
MSENDIHGIFYTAMLIAELNDPRGQEVFDLLKVKYKDDSNAMVAVNQYEGKFKEGLGK